MRKSHLNRTLENVRKTLNASESASYGFEEASQLDVEAERIVSSESGHYILIQGKDLGSSSQEESQEEDSEGPKDLSDLSKGSTTSQTPKILAKSRQACFNPTSNRSKIETADRTTLNRSSMEIDVASISSVDSGKEETVSHYFPVCNAENPGSLVSASINSEASSKDSAFSSTLITEDKESNRKYDDAQRSEEPALATKDMEQLDTAEGTGESHAMVLVQEKYQHCHTSAIKSDETSSDESSSLAEEMDFLVRGAKEKEKIQVKEDAKKNKEWEKERKVVVEAEQADIETTAEEKEVAARVEKVSHLLALPGGDMGFVLRKEMDQLDRDVTQQEKQAAGVADWMYSDAQVSMFWMRVLMYSDCALRCMCMGVLNGFACHRLLLQSNDVST